MPHAVCRCVAPPVFKLAARCIGSQAKYCIWRSWEPSSGVAPAGSARASATGGVRVLWCSVLRVLLAVLRVTEECRRAGSAAAVLQVLQCCSRVRCRHRSVSHT
jgi:hypothetical protein